MRYYVHKDGVIVAAGDASALTAIEAMWPGHTVTVGQANPWTQYVTVGGTLAAYSAELAEERQRLPPIGARWTVTGWVDERTEEMANVQAIAALKQQIVAIEARQPRAIREAVLTNDTTYLDEIEAEIAPLRAQIQALTPGDD